MPSEFWTTAEIGGVEDVDIVVEYTYHRFCAGATDGRFGPKLEPDEPAHIEIDGIKLADGQYVELTEEQEAAIIREIEEDLASQAADVPERDYEDWGDD